MSQAPPGGKPNEAVPGRGESWFPWQGVFIIGSPRSGSTWLQALLAAHPQVASSVELGVFNRYVAHWVESWAFEQEVLAPRHVPQGLRYVLTEEELREFLRQFVGECYRRLAARKPGATHVLDKHPGYSKYVGLINEMVPGARFLHMMRDGRDVAVSMRRAGSEMAFGTLSAGAAGRVWARAVREARAAARFAGRYLEVRYEDLLNEPRSTLARVFEFCSLPCTPTLLAEVADQHSFEAMRARRATADAAVPAHPLHYQRGRPGRWQEELTLLERYDVHRQAGPLLVELGYAQPSWWRTNPAEGVYAPLLWFFQKALQALGRKAKGNRG